MRQTTSTGPPVQEHHGSAWGCDPAPSTGVAGKKNSAYQCAISNHVGLLRTIWRGSDVEPQSQAVPGSKGVRLASVEISRPSYTVFYSA